MNTLLSLSALVSTLLTAGLLLTSDYGVAGTLYKWVDENGRVSYQDRPPTDVTDFESADYSDREVGRLLQQDPEEKRQQVLESRPVTIYVADNCDACDTLRVFLEKLQVPFTEKDLSADEEAQRVLIDIGGKLQVPATTIGDKLLWGYNRQSLQKELVEAGYEQPSRETADQPDETVDSGSDDDEDNDESAVTQN